MDFNDFLKHDDRARDLALKFNEVVSEESTAEVILAVSKFFSAFMYDAKPFNEEKFEQLLQIFSVSAKVEYFALKQKVDLNDIPTAGTA